MTADKGFKGAPFGHQTPRFEVHGIHPSRLKPGTYTQVSNNAGYLSSLLGPGRYDVDVGDFNFKSMEIKARGPGWARQYETEKLAAMPHLLNREQHSLKKELVRKLGPGSYEYRDFLTEDKPRSTRGIIDSLEKRFNQVTKLVTPGPGTYGKGGVPHSGIEEKNRESFGSVGLLDMGPKNRGLPITGCEVAPGTYEVKSGVDELLAKKTGTRGPYDCFSLDRNKPMKTGHFASPGIVNQSYLRPPDNVEERKKTDELNARDKKYHGRFLKGEARPLKPTDRLSVTSQSQWPRDESDPGPGYYEPNFIEKHSSKTKNNHPPFNSSSMRMDKRAVKFFTGNYNHVGPGRYDVQRFEESHGKRGHTSAFKSQVSRPNSEQIKFLSERLRPRNIPVHERLQLTEKSRTIA